MTIKRSRRGWRGTDGADLDEYLVALTSDDGDAVDRVVHASCADCAGGVFTLDVDGDEGCARRSCVGCERSTFVLDTEDVLEDAGLTEVTCPMDRNHREFNVAVGFALRANGDVRWVYLGLRCIADGLLGSVADWSISETPSAHLLDRV